MQASTLAALEFGQPPPAPRELVEGIVRFGSVTLLAGREGSGKTFASMALAAAVVTGQPWMGLPTVAGRVLVIDEENSPRDVADRLYGLGLRPEHRDRLRYFNRHGAQLARPEWAARFEGEIEAFRPALIIVDGATSAGGIDPNSNADVGDLFTVVLRRWAARFDCGVVLLHHVAKASRDDDDDAILGAVAFRTQADAHIKAIRREPHFEGGTTPEGHLRALYRYELRSTSKARWGFGDGWIQPFAVVSERDADGTMRWLRVETDGGTIHKATRGPSREEAMAVRIAGLLADHGPLERAVIAEHLEAEPTGGTFKRALRYGLEHGLFAKPRQGRYAPAGANGPVGP